MRLVLLALVLTVVGCGDEQTRRAAQPGAGAGPGPGIFDPVEPPASPPDGPPAVRSAAAVLESAVPGIGRRRLRACSSTVSASGTYRYFDVATSGALTCRAAVGVVGSYARATRRIERRFKLDCWPGICFGNRVPDEVVDGWRAAVADFSDASPSYVLVLMRGDRLIRTYVYDDA